jgi:hypothetical protein
VRSLSLVELKTAGERLQHALGDASQVAALHPGVVIDADPGEERNLLPPQPRNAPVIAIDW